MKGPHFKLKVLVQTIRERDEGGVTRHASRSPTLGLVGPDDASARPAGENEIRTNLETTGLGDERQALFEVQPLAFSAG